MAELNGAVLRMGRNAGYRKRPQALSAGSTLPRPNHETGMLYAGQPATVKKALSAEARYFTRDKGFVN